MTRTYQQSGGLAILVAAAAVGLAACGGSASSTPQVASLSKSSGTGSGSSGAASSGAGGSGAAKPNGNATQLLDEWAVCMRRHGDPGQIDPTIDSNKVIHITVPNAEPGNDEQQISSEAHGSTGPCSSYELAAEKALRGGQPAPKAPTMAQQLSYARCMRTHGVTKFPDPNATGRTYLGNLDTNGVVFQNADKVCSKQNGLPVSGSPGPPGLVMVQSAGIPGGGH